MTPSGTVPGARGPGKGVTDRGAAAGGVITPGAGEGGMTMAGGLGGGIPGGVAPGMAEVTAAGTTGVLTSSLLLGERGS